MDTAVESMTADPQYGGGECTRSPICDRYVGQYRKRLVGRYIAVDGGSALTWAGIPLAKLGSFDEVITRARRIHKANAVRKARKVDEAGFRVGRFEWRNHTPDIVDINHSMEVRSGGSMTEAYRRSVEDMGGAPASRFPPKDPVCPRHWTVNWGIFAPAPGHRQGEVRTDERLVGYIRVKRQGNIAIYTTILGHGDFLDRGIMYRLHFGVLEWVCTDASSRLLADLDALVYGAIDSGNEGLRRWKKRGLFEPLNLSISSEDLVTLEGMTS